MVTTRVFRLLQLRQFRRQPLRVFLMIVAAGAGIATTITAGLIATSINGSVKDALADLGGQAPLRVVSYVNRGGLEANVADVTVKVDGVASVVPAVHAVTIAESARGEQTSLLAVGVDCRVEALAGDFGCDEAAFKPVHPDAPVVISSSLARRLGRGGVIRSNEGRIAIDGVVTNDTFDEFNGGRVAVFTLETAQHLFSRPDRLDALYVVPEPGVDVSSLKRRIGAAVGEANLVLGRDDLTPSMGGFGPLLPLIGLVTIVGLGLSSMLVYNLVALSLAERRKDLAIAGAVGVPPSALVRAVLMDAAVLGFFGGIGGGAMGVVIAMPMLREMSRVLVERSMGIPVTLHISAALLASGVVLGVIASVAAAWVPARRVRKLELTSELHGRAALVEEQPAGTGRRLLALLVVAGACVVVSNFAQRNGSLSAWQPPAATLTLLVASFITFAAAGIAAPMVIGVLRRIWKPAGSAGLAMANVVRRPRRTRVIAAATASAVGLACVLASLSPSIRAVADDYYGSGDDELVWVSTLPTNNSSGIDARVSPATLGRLAQIDGVAAVERLHFVGLADDSGEFAVGAYDNPSTLKFNVVVGQADADVILRGDAVVTSAIARKRGLRPGSTMSIPTPHGPESIRVAGITMDSANNGLIVRVSAQRYKEFFGNEPSREAFLRPEPGITPADLKQRVLDADLDPDLQALTGDELASDLSREIGEQIQPFWIMQRTLLFVTLFAALSTLLLIGLQRRREMGVLGAIGFGGSRLAGMTVLEAGVSGIAGAILGVLGSLVGFEVLRNAAATSLGTRPPFRFEVMPGMVAVLLAVAVVAIGALIPAWRVSRIPIVEALRDE